MQATCIYPHGNVFALTPVYQYASNNAVAFIGGIYQRAESAATVAFGIALVQQVGNEVHTFRAFSTLEKAR